MKKLLVFLCILGTTLGVAVMADATMIQNPGFTTGFIGWYTEYTIPDGGDLFRINKPDPNVDRALFGGKMDAPGTPVGTWNLTYDYTVWMSQGFDITSSMLDIGFDYKFTDLNSDDSFTFAFYLKDTATKALSNINIFKLQTTTGFAAFQQTVDLTGIDLTNKKGVIAFFINETGNGETDFTSTQAILMNPSVSGAASVPDASTMLLIGTSLIGLIGFERKDKK